MKTQLSALLHQVQTQDKLSESQSIKIKQLSKLQAQNQALQSTVDAKELLLARTADKHDKLQKELDEINTRLKEQAGAKKQTAAAGQRKSQRFRKPSA